MSCNCENNSNPISYIPSTTGCTECGDSTCSDTANITYSGATLTCSNQVSGTKLEVILQALDAKICSITGTDFSTFDTHCIVNPDNSQIGTQQEFVEAITDYLCNFKTTYNTFITNYNTFVTNITDSVVGAHIPGITSCGGVGIISTDTNAQAFTKTANAICTIQAAINPSAANWNSCSFTVGSAPTTITGGFNKVLDYICQVKNLIPSAVTLPTFDNTGSCLGGTLTTTDTLVSTISKIKTRLCAVPIVDYMALNYGCVDGATNLTDALQNTIDRVNTLQIYTWDSTYFTLSNINDTYPCLGKHVTINPSGLDKKVASNSADGSPGYLDAKLQSGTGISLDSTGTPGKIVINNSAPADNKVKVNGSDSSAGYLDAKIDGVADTTGALSIAATANVGNTAVIITPTIDYTILATEVLNAIDSSFSLSTILGQIACAYNCANAPLVQAVITNTAESGSKLFTVTLDQNTPTVTWYHGGATVLTHASAINTGTYSITTLASNPQATLAIKNNDSSSMTATVYVRDILNNAVTGSTSFVQAISAGATYTVSAFQLGTGVTNYVINIELS